MSEVQDRVRPCHPTEIALKSFFLGPQSENAPWLLESFEEILRSWFDWRRTTFPQDGSAVGGGDQERAEFQECRRRTRVLLAELTHRFEAELPKFSPRYVGHMFSELSMPALLGHILTLLHNPNIIARESATVATDIENEAVESLARMLGLPRFHGHFTSGGTIANYECVVRAQARLYAWMAVGAVANRHRHPQLDLFESAHLGWERFASYREHGDDEALSPFLPEIAGAASAGRALGEAFDQRFRGPVLVVPSSAHYSWKKAARILGLGEKQLELVESDDQGRYKVDDLQARIARCRRDEQPILAVVSVAGTTEVGTIDPIDEIADLLDGLREREGIHIWHHVDAAYGGFFCSMLRECDGSTWSKGHALDERALSALAAISRADSVTMDPHKLGYVPYASGAFLCADGRDYTSVRVLAPYLDYAQGRPETPILPSGPDRGPYTLEGSRSAAGAVATWLTSRAMGLDQAGYGLLLARTVRQKQKLQAWMASHLPSARFLPGLDTNLLCFCIADPGEPLSRTNARTLRLLSRLASESRYFLTKTAFRFDGPQSAMAKRFVEGWNGLLDEEQVLVLRLCLMNPFFDSSELDVDHTRSLVISLSELAD